MKTMVREILKIDAEASILIEGLPGLGMVGKIAVKYLIKQLKAKKFAELYSPHFPYHVLVNKEGRIRLLRGELYYWSENGKSLILLTGDSQAQTIEGQYEMANCILEFAEKHGVKTIITIGGYKSDNEKGKVVCASTNRKLLEKALNAGAIESPAGNPIVGMAGLLLGLSKLKGMEGLCLLGETKGYMPDPKAAKKVLEVLTKLLDLNVNLSDLDREIKRIEKIKAEMRKVRAESVISREEIREERKITYIS